MKGLFCSAILFIASMGFCKDFEIKDHQFLLIGSQSTLPLQIVPLKQTPSPNSMQIRIVFPKEDSLERGVPIRSQVRLIGFPLGVKTHASGVPSLREYKNGQSVRVLIDDKPYFHVTLDSEDSEDANLDVFRKSLNFKLPNDIPDGEHIMRAYPVLSYGESIKKPENFAVTTFYKGSRKPVIRQDLNKPYLTYNEPYGVYKLKNPNDPILLDFYISNCTLAREAYKVQVSINGEKVAKLYQWTPYLIYGLEKGKHVVKLELLGPDDQLVQGAFNSAKRDIEVK